MFHVKHILKSLKQAPFHEIVFYVFLFIIPFQTRTLFEPASAYIGSYFNYYQAFFLYLSDIVLFGCFMGWILFDHRPIRRKRLFWWIFAYFTWILLTLLHVERLGLGVSQALKWLEVLFLIIYVSETLKFKQFLVSSQILFVSAIFQALLAISQFHMQHMLSLSALGEYIAPLGTAGLATLDIGSEKIIRAYGTFPHPNVLAGFLVLAFISGLFLVSHATKWRKWGIWLGIFIIIAGLFLTFSRSAWLVTVMSGVAFLTYWVFKKKWKAVQQIVLVALVSCATIGILYAPYLQSRISETSTHSVSYEDRGFFNQLGLNTIVKQPIWGSGVGNYVEQQLTDNPGLADWQYQPPHNIFIEIAAESGLVGLVLFLGILFELFIGLRRGQFNELKFTVCCLAAAIILLGQVDHYFATIQQGRLLLGLVFGFMAALPNLKNETFPHETSD